MTQHVYKWGDCYIVASSVDEAFEVADDERVLNEDEAQDFPNDVRLLPDSDPISIYVDEDGNITNEDDAFDELELTAAEWIEKLKKDDGKGFVLRDEN
jgi:hypothetical protein